MGLAEPSVKRDGYAVGSREGSMYRRSSLTNKSPWSPKLTLLLSTGNLNVSSGVAGSRAGSESKDLPKGNWKERRASTSDLKVVFTFWIARVVTDFVFRDPGSELVATWLSLQLSLACPLEVGQEEVETW